MQTLHQKIKCIVISDDTNVMTIDRARATRIVFLFAFAFFAGAGVLQFLSYKSYSNPEIVWGGIILSILASLIFLYNTRPNLIQIDFGHRTVRLASGFKKLSDGPPVPFDQVPFVYVRRKQRKGSCSYSFGLRIGNAGKERDYEIYLTSGRQWGNEIRQYGSEFAQRMGVEYREFGWKSLL